MIWTFICHLKGYKTPDIQFCWADRRRHVEQRARVPAILVQRTSYGRDFHVQMIDREGVLTIRVELTGPIGSV